MILAFPPRALAPGSRSPPDNGGVVAHVYILRCSDGTLYTGATKDLVARIKAHRVGAGSKYVRARLPVELVYKERFTGPGAWSRALKREAAIKRMSREEKLFVARFCLYCGGGGMAWDPQTGEGPTCPECEGTGERRVG